MKYKILLFVSQLVLCSLLSAQYENGIGINVNAGYSYRLNASLCYETRLKGNLMLRANAGLGNFLPFNVKSPSDRLLLPTRFDNNRDNYNRHIDLTYNGYSVESSNSKIIAPEFKLGILYMTGNFRQKNRVLSGLYLGYQTSFSFITQSYSNTYVNDKVRVPEEVNGTALLYAWSPINVLAGYKKLIGEKTTIDIGVEQSIGFVFNRKFESQRDFYFHPYSGLKFDLSIGIRRIF